MGPRTVAVCAALLLCTPAGLAGATRPEDTSRHLQVLAINDLHGNLEPPTGSDGRIEGTPAGGVAYLATHLRRLRARQAHSVTVGDGDLIGGSPLVSSHFGDRPTVEVLGALGLAFSAMGNHELDRGLATLEKLQRGARFQWLAANVTRPGSPAPVMAPYRIVRAGDVRVGFIGLPLEGTPAVVAPGGADGLRFADEADTINRYAAELDRRGVKAIFVLLHEGGEQAGTDPNGCDGLTGAAVGIVERLSDRVDVVATGHSHEAYVCRVDGKLVASGGSYGRLITDYDLVFDRDGDVERATARNYVVTRDVPPDPEVARIVDRYRRRVAPVADRVVGTATAALSRTGNAAGESALGDVVADAQRAATGADLALMNATNLRAGVPAGEVTYGDLAAVHPYATELQVKALTGAQLKALLEQQFDDDADRDRPPLQVSAGFTYAYDDAGAVSELALDGAPIAPGRTVRVALNEFLAEGGDGFTVARDAPVVAGGPVDVEALVDYFAGGPVAPGPRDRITRRG